MMRSKSEKLVYASVPAIPGETFGHYRRKLDVKRRQMRADRAVEHPVKNVVEWVFAIGLATLTVFTVPVGGFWIFMLVCLGVAFHEWRKVRRDRREWKKALERSAEQADGGPLVI